MLTASSDSGRCNRLCLIPRRSHPNGLASPPHSAPWLESRTPDAVPVPAWTWCHGRHRTWSISQRKRAVAGLHSARTRRHPSLDSRFGSGAYSTNWPNPFRGQSKIAQAQCVVFVAGSFSRARSNARVNHSCRDMPPASLASSKASIGSSGIFRSRIVRPDARFTMTTLYIVLHSNGSSLNALLTPPD